MDEVQKHCNPKVSEPFRTDQLVTTVVNNFSLLSVSKFSGFQHRERKKSVAILTLFWSHASVLLVTDMTTRWQWEAPMVQPTLQSQPLSTHISIHNSMHIQWNSWRRELLVRWLRKFAAIEQLRSRANTSFISRYRVRQKFQLIPSFLASTSQTCAWWWCLAV
jgi:hypothetical protein